MKSSSGFVFSITLAWTGGAAGNIVYLRDGSNGVAPIEVAFVLDAANGTITKEWPQGKEFENGIFYDEGAASNVLVEMTYK